MRAVAVLLAASACAVPQRPAPKVMRPAPIAAKAYAPLAFRADAKLPTQALILGTDAQNGSTLLPLVGAAAQVTFDAMIVHGAGAHAIRSYTQVRLDAAPGAGRLDLAQALPAGAEEWAASAQVAAAVALAALDKDDADYALRVTVSGYIDGAGASALVAVGLAAALTGDRLDAHATVCGAVLPDGAIAPVAALPEKLSEALGRGATRFGYPAGQRIARAQTGELVDLEAVAKAHGARAVEVATIYDAYALATGAPLPAPAPLAEADLALDDAARAALAAAYDEARRAVAGDWGWIPQLQQAGRVPAPLVELADRAQRGGERAEALHAQGKLPAALVAIVAARADAATANRAYSVLSLVQGGDVAGAHSLTHPGYPAVEGQAYVGIVALFHDLAALPRAQLGAPTVADRVIDRVVPAVLAAERARGEAALAAAVGPDEPPVPAAPVSGPYTGEQVMSPPPPLVASPALLATAERLARMHARAALVATGRVPPRAALAYQLALAERADDPARALLGFQAASALAEAAVARARR